MREPHVRCDGCGRRVKAADVTTLKEAFGAGDLLVETTYAYCKGCARKMGVRK